MVTLRRIEIHRFRNVEPNTVIELHSGINVLLGRNGTGKTTLLQWMADILSGETRRWAGEPYDVSLEILGEQVRAAVRVKNNPRSMYERFPQRMKHGGRALAEALVERGRAEGLEVDADIETPEGRYGLEIRSSEVTLRYADAEPIVLDDPEHNYNFIFSFFLFMCSIMGQSFGLTESESLHQFSKDWHNGYESLHRFDEALRVFSAITAQRGGDGGGTRLQLAYSDGSLHLVEHDLLSNDLAERIREHVMEARQKNASLTTFSFPHTNLPFLAKAVELFGYSSASVEVALLEKRVADEGVELYDLGDFRFIFERPDGSIISHGQLSFGQKRMLAFLYYLAASPSLIVVDELVNGLHHAWIDACLEEIGDRQALLTSQNPLLLDYLSFASPDEVRRRFVLCRSERRDGKERLIWRNPTAEEAESFFSAYEAGIQHVGEILMDKGLW